MVIRLGKAHVTQLDVDGLAVVITRKPIKNVYARISRTDGQVRISAPAALSDKGVESFVRTNWAWISSIRKQVLERPAQPDFKYETGEIHRVFGEPYRLVIVEGANRNQVQRNAAGDLQLTVRTGAAQSTRAVILDGFYREILAEHIPMLVAKWEPVMGVTVAEWRIRKMTTRWGTCNIRVRRIWLNLELARRPEKCLEYVVVHEMNHLLERGHTKRFYALMDHWMPDWKRWRNDLNTGKSEPD